MAIRKKRAKADPKVVVDAPSDVAVEAPARDIVEATETPTPADPEAVASNVESVDSEWL